MNRSARLALKVLALGALSLTGFPKPESATATPPAESTDAPAANVPDDPQKTLYALGAAIAQQSFPDVKLQESDVEAIQRGFTDAVLGRKLESDPSEAGPAIQQLLTDRRTAAGAEEKEAAKAFLAEAAQAPGAETTPSGLVYQIVSEGQGAQPKATDRVKVRYRGMLRDGSTLMISTGGEPAVFPLNTAMPCWIEGFQKMKVGGTAKLTCPADLAYGDRGLPGHIKPGAPLVFEVELLEIVQAPPAPAPGAEPGAPPAAKAPDPAKKN